jgi:uroporphyrinogen-III synthase
LRLRIIASGSVDEVVGTRTAVLISEPNVHSILLTLNNSFQPHMAKPIRSTTKGTAQKELMVNSILITQPRPDTDKSPYFDLARKYNLKLQFHPFILVEGLSGKEFRKQRIDITEHTAIIFNSRNAVDHFFRICEELKVKVSQDMKYFCITEAVALYLQKFILYRKRKVFFSADGSTEGLMEVIAKHKNNERFILPTSDNGKNDVNQFLQKNNIAFSEATLYRTVSNDIAPVMADEFDMIVFFSPFSVQTLFEHDPSFKQNGTLIGAFGPTTSKAVEEAGLRLDVKAPAPNAPSMVSALERYILDMNK